MHGYLRSPHRRTRLEAFVDLLPPPPTYPGVRAPTEPWEYLVYTGLGAYVGWKTPAYEERLFNDINEMRADRHMPPLVTYRQFGVPVLKPKDEVEE